MQGDEPLLNPNHIDRVVSLKNFSPDIVILYCRLYFRFYRPSIDSNSGRNVSYKSYGTLTHLLAHPHQSIYLLLVLSLALERYSALEPTRKNLRILSC